MQKIYNRRKYYSAIARPLADAVAIIVLVAGVAKAQDTPLATLQSAPGTSLIPFSRLIGASPISTSPIATMASTQSSRWKWIDDPTTEPGGYTASAENNQVHSDGIRRRITLEQAKQQAFTKPAASPLAHLAQLSLEAAKQHVLGAQADYLPKISTTVANLHYSDYLGQVLSITRPLAGTSVDVPVPLLQQNQTIVAVTLVQPITPLFQVHQLVKIARADERIAMAKAGVSVAKNTSDAKIEEAYFKLLIAQRKVTSAELKLRNTETRPQYASANTELLRVPVSEPELLEVRQAVATTSAEVRALTASLNRAMGWPDDTELDLVRPGPLVENISLKDISDTPTGANPEVVEAEQTAVKARAAAVLSKLAYVPMVAATSGFIYQNAVPLLPNTFGYGGVMVSYNLFDFGKREAAVKEAHAQMEMAQIGVELTKAKVAENVKTSYSELERTRQLSQLAQQMGSSMTRLMDASFTPDNLEVKAAISKVETDMLEADLAHRQAYARLKALMNPQR